MRKRIILVAFTVAGLLSLAAPTPATGAFFQWFARVSKYVVAVEKAAKAAAKAQTAAKLAEEAANAAKTAREIAEQAKTLESAAKATKAEAAAARAKAEAARAKAEAARADKAAKEKGPVRETAKEAIKGATEVAKKAAEIVPKLNAGKQLPAFVRYLIAIPAIMLGAILFLGGVILLLEPQFKNDAERLAAIRAAIRRNPEKNATKFITAGERPGVWLKI